MSIGNRSISNACAAQIPSDDEWSIWVAPELKDYRAVWMAASNFAKDRTTGEGLVPRMEDWGPAIDIDHLLPRSWALEMAGEVALLRIFPVFAEINRSWGAGPEKIALHEFRRGTRQLPRARNGVWRADTTIMKKILGLGY